MVEIRTGKRRGPERTRASIAVPMLHFAAKWPGVTVGPGRPQRLRSSCPPVPGWAPAAIPSRCGPRGSAGYESGAVFLWERPGTTTQRQPLPGIIAPGRHPKGSHAAVRPRGRPGFHAWPDLGVRRGIRTPNLRLRRAVPYPVGPVEQNFRGIPPGRCRFRSRRQHRLAPTWPNASRKSAGPVGFSLPMRWFPTLSLIP